MEYRIERLTGLKVIGFERSFPVEIAYDMIPDFWDEFREEYLELLFMGARPVDEQTQAVKDYKIGQMGISIDDIGGNGRFRYMIAGIYTGGPVPEDMTVMEFPEMDWVKFRCIGPMPEALQKLNTEIFTEWLPNNETYELAMGANIEWYSDGEIDSEHYFSEIWLPVKEKK